MKKYDNFCASLENLKDIFIYEEPYDNVIMTGLVALFEICFEQSWKAIKEVLMLQGVAEGQTGSPRQILKAAYQVGLVKDEEVWLQALVSRNNVAHAYNKAIAMDIICLTKEKYYDMFCDLRKEMEREYERD